ncbi:hypothetical protein B7P43_G09779, partial [Cryptotermes secundus]
MPSLEIMGFAGVIGYYRMLYISWFFAACSLTCFGWYVLLIMEKGKDKKNKNETTSKIFKMQEVCIKKVSEQSAMTNSRRNAFKQKEFQIQKKVTATPHMQLNNVNVNDKKVQKVGEVTESFSQRLNNMEHPTEKIPTQQAEMTTSKTWFIKILGLLFGRTLDKNVDKFKEDIDTLSDRLKKLEDHIKKVEKYKEVTYTLSKKLKNVEDHMEKVEKFKQVSHTLSNRLKNVEDNIEKIQEDIKVLVSVSVQQSEMALRAKERENEAVSDILSEGLELLEASFKLREDNGKIIDIMSEGVELLEAPFKQVGKCKQVTHTLPNMLKNLEDYIEKEDDAFERLDMVEDSFKKENEVMSCACDSGD